MDCELREFDRRSRCETNAGFTCATFRALFSMWDTQAVKPALQLA
jgi:hypothetical protein